jgi:hypothetical protein
MKFTATHHAVLFALLSRSVITHLGAERGEQVVRQAVRLYGEQRGHRMALRAQRDGEPLSMLNFMAYGEWQTGPGEFEQRLGETVPDARSFVTRCPWSQAWMENDLLQYGRLYCLEIDLALARGFNLALRLEVLSTQSNDLRPSEFVYHAANLTPQNLAILDQKKAANQLNGGVLSWEYHAGHIFAAVKSTLLEESVAEAQTILQEALAAFAQRYGDEAVRAVLAYQSVDFTLLPDSN